MILPAAELTESKLFDELGKSGMHGKVLVCADPRTEMIACRILGGRQGVALDPYMEPDTWELRDAA